jgi:hypothetical protein
MTRRLLSVTVAAVLIVTITACAPESERRTSPAPTGTDSATSAGTEGFTPPTSTATPEEPNSVIGTVVRFASDRTSVDVTIGEDNPGVRDFLSMLPLTLPFEELNGREKIAYLPRELDHAGSPGSDPENGDLIYFTPWGNLGFYYNAAGIEYSDATLHFGTYRATEEQLALLEGGDVTIEIVD